VIQSLKITGLGLANIIYLGVVDVLNIDLETIIDIAFVFSTIFLVRYIKLSKIGIPSDKCPTCAAEGLEV